MFFIDLYNSRVNIRPRREKQTRQYISVTISPGAPNLVNPLACKSLSVLLIRAGRPIKLYVSSMLVGLTVRRRGAGKLLHISYAKIRIISLMFRGLKVSSVFTGIGICIENNYLMRFLYEEQSRRLVHRKCPAQSRHLVLNLF